MFAAEEREQKLDRKGDLLSTLEKHVSFAALAAEIDRIAPRPNGKQGGRPPYPTELMVRALVLQHLYNLSDESLEYQLLDRLSFQRFCGLRHSSSIPDANTLWVFRAQVEHVFGAMLALGGKGLRSIGLARAVFGLSIKAAVYNLRRLRSLKESGIAPI